MRILKNLFKGLIRSLLSYILISGFITMFIWFFTDVIFQKDFGYLNVWKWVYLILLIGTQTISVFLAIYIFGTCLLLINKLKISYGDVEEAILVHELNKLKPIREWTKEWVLKALKINREMRDLEHALSKYSKGY